MNASELRIGNWIYNKISATELQVTYDRIEGVEHSPEYYEPIRLTKKTVLQLGFKDQFGSTTLGLTASYGAHLEWDETEKVVVLLDCDSGVIGEPCRFIHEVQNLYFALERKDLTLNPKANG